MSLAQCFYNVENARSKFYPGVVSRPEYALRTLSKFIQDCHAARLQPGWSDFGRLEEL